MQTSALNKIILVLFTYSPLPLWMIKHPLENDIAPKILLLPEKPTGTRD